MPSIEGLETVEHAFAFMILDDAYGIMEAVTPESQVLIVGAGLIGLKCAEGLSGRAAGITVVDLAPYILSSILDADGADIVKRHLEEHGIAFHMEDSVTRLDPGTAHLKSGKQLPFDVLVLAVGIRPNTGLIQGIDGHVNRGIVFNALAETSLSDIYSAGDCAEGLDSSADEYKVLALLPSAYRQGECAGINMAGGTCMFDQDIPMNAIGFFGLHMVTAGNYQGETYFSHERGTYKRLFYRDDLLKGHIIIGNIEKAGIYIGLIQEKMPLSQLNFQLICQKPSLMAFSTAYRNQKLGGATQ